MRRGCACLASGGVSPALHEKSHDVLGIMTSQFPSLDADHLVRANGFVDKPLTDTASQRQLLRLQHTTYRQPVANIVVGVLKRRGQHGEFVQTDTVNPQLLLDDAFHVNWYGVLRDAGGLTWRGRWTIAASGSSTAR